MEVSYKIKKLLGNMELIENLLKHYDAEVINYELVVDILNDQIDQIISSDGYLDKESTRLFEKLLLSGDLRNESIKHYNYVIREILVGRNVFTKTFLRRVIKKFTVAYAAEMGLECRCVVRKLGGTKRAEECRGKIRINQWTVDEFLLTMQPRLLLTIFHEITHTEHFSEMRHKVSYRNYRFFKDAFLNNENPNYYNINHAKTSYEAYADLRAFRILKTYIQSIGLQYNGAPFIEHLKQLAANYRNEDREPVGEDITVDEIVFGLLKRMPNLLVSCPALSLEYYIRDGKIVRKTDDELCAIVAQLEEEVKPMFDYYRNSGLTRISDIYTREDRPMLKEDFIETMCTIRDNKKLLAYRRVIENKKVLERK